MTRALTRAEREAAIAAFLRAKPTRDLECAHALGLPVEEYREIIAAEMDRCRRRDTGAISRRRYDPEQFARVKRRNKQIAKGIERWWRENVAVGEERER